MDIKEYLFINRTMQKRITGTPASAQGKFPAAPLHTRSYLVHTVYGVSIVDANSLVYVKIGNEYVRKPMDEVKKGEEILFGKEGIPEITLDKVSEALAKSERYAATQPILFRQLPDGSYTTAFRHALLEGMVAHPERWPGLPLPVTWTLTNKQGVVVTRCIRAKLEEAAVPPVSANHIRYYWLVGKTIAPMNREQVFRVLEPLAPGLAKLLEDPFHEAYRLYITIRRAVIREVSNILKGNASRKAGEEEGEEEPGGHRASEISTRPEIRLVMEYFASEITERYAAGRVLDVRELRETEEIGGEGKEKGELFRGIVTGEIGDPEIKIKSPARIFQERRVIGCISPRISYEFLQREGIRKLKPVLEGDAGRPLWYTMDRLHSVQTGFIEDTLRKIRKSLQRMEMAGIRGAEEIFYPEGFEVQLDVVHREAGDRFMRKLANGEMDAAYGLTPGTLARFYDQVLRLDRAQPFELTYHRYLMQLIEHKREKARKARQAISTRQEEAEIHKLDQKLRKWGILDRVGDQAVREVDMPTAMALCMGIGKEYGNAAEDIFSGRVTPVGALQKAGEDVERMRREGTIIEDEAALQVLREMGFGELEKLYPRADERVKPYI